VCTTTPAESPSTSSFLSASTISVPSWKSSNSRSPSQTPARTICGFQESSRTCRSHPRRPTFYDISVQIFANEHGVPKAGGQRR
jgi:hypothetical protein